MIFFSLSSIFFSLLLSSHFSSSLFSSLLFYFLFSLFFSSFFCSLLFTSLLSFLLLSSVLFSFLFSFLFFLFSSLLFSSLLFSSLHFSSLLFLFSSLLYFLPFCHFPFPSFIFILNPANRLRISQRHFQVIQILSSFNVWYLLKSNLCIWSEFSGHVDDSDVIILYFTSLTKIKNFLLMFYPPVCLVGSSVQFPRWLGGEPYIVFANQYEMNKFGRGKTWIPAHVYNREPIVSVE